MIVGDYVLIAGDGNEHVADFGSIVDRHHAEAVHDGFEGLHGINFSDDDVRSVAFRAHGDAASTPSVTGDNYLEAGEKEVRGANDAVER